MAAVHLIQCSSSSVSKGTSRRVEVNDFEATPAALPSFNTCGLMKEPHGDTPSVLLPTGVVDRPFHNSLLSICVPWS